MRVTLYNRGECHLAQWESLDELLADYNRGYLLFADGDKLTFEETETQNRSKTNETDLR